MPACILLPATALLESDGSLDLFQAGELVFFLPEQLQEWKRNLKKIVVCSFKTTESESYDILNSS
jgi:hypothetical protein